MKETLNFIDWPTDGLLIEPLLPAIAAQAAEADASRSVSDEVIALIKDNPVMGMTASPELGGLNSTVTAVAHELAAVAACCSSTAWCLWNHLCTYHFFCALLGPEHDGLLGGITANREWVCFPAGASTRVNGVLQDDQIVLNGSAAFGSGARYGEFAGVVFVLREIQDARRFTLVDLRSPGVTVDPTWKAMSLRASATDHVRYKDATVPAGRHVPFPDKFREVFRAPDFPVIHHRYREDWVALSDLWLGAMAVGLASAALAEAAEGIRERVAIAGVKMIERPTIHVNLGQAGTLIKTAGDTVLAACAETDARIEAAAPPTETDYLRQLGASMQALACCDDAMRLILRVLGGNGLREGGNFERRYRDFQAMPLHINAHRDRVTEQIGRHLLGLATENTF
ncbi:MAG: acyl-CoA dehydrogenase family protein [Gammaproteobacteria bacterium]|nr:acyl-CoA dehydrogenase family protein [Gammaproteobacteria bacterium]